MKKITVIAALLVSVVLHAQQTVIHDPNAEARSVGEFSAIDISGGIDLYISPGSEPGLAVSASDVSTRSKIRTEVSDGVLKIWADKNWKWNSGSRKMIVYVSCRSLNRLTASGASDVYMNGTMTGDGMKIRLAGASDFKGNLKLNSLDLGQSGASDANISGSVSRLTISASGASKLRGYDLETETCNARLSGASDIRLTIQKELSATASGASSIDFKGNAQIKDVHTSGASKVNKKG